MTREYISAALVLAACALVPSCLKPSPASSEAAYTAEQLRCVDQAPSREASRACRAEVDRRWGVDGGGK